MIWSIEREDRVDLKRKPILWGLDKDELFFGCFVLFVGIVKGGPELDIIPPAMSKLLLIIGILPMCIKILRTSYTKNEWFIIIFMGLLAIISTLFTHRLGLMLVIVMILGAKNMKVSRILNMFLTLQVVTFLIAVIPQVIKLAMGGAVNGILYENRDIYGVVEVTDQFRISLGYGHPNALQQNVCFLSILLICCMSHEIKKWQIALITVFNLSFYFLTYSNTGLTIYLLFLLFYFIWRYNKTFINMIGKYSPYIFILLTAVNILIVACFTGSTWMMKLDSIMVGRLHWAHEFMMSLGFSFWGRDIAEANIGYEYLDNGYVFLLLRYGVIIFVLYIIAVYKLLSYLYRKNQLLAIIVIGVVHVYFIMENFMLAGLYNLTYIYLAPALYEVSYFRKDG